jgi:hypothetical protein
VETDKLAEKPGASAIAEIFPPASRPLMLPLTPRLDSLHDPVIAPLLLSRSLFRSKR